MKQKKKQRKKTWPLLRKCIFLVRTQAAKTGIYPDFLFVNQNSFIQ